jgi:hypothetical protein
MSTPSELRARAAELESCVPPITAGPRTDDERMWLEKATALRAEADQAERARAVTAADHVYAQGWQDTADRLHQEPSASALHEAATQAGRDAGDWPLKQARAHGMQQAAAWAAGRDD